MSYCLFFNIENTKISGAGCGQVQKGGGKNQEPARETSPSSKEDDKFHFRKRGRLTKEEERELSRTSKNLFNWVKVLKEPIEGEHPGPRLLNRRGCKSS